MIDKIKNLKWQFQLMLMIAFAALIYSGVWYFFS